MSKNFEEIAETASPAEETAPPPAPQQEDKDSKPGWLESLAHLGLGDTTMQYATGALTLITLAAIVLLLRAFFTGSPQSAEALLLESEAEASLLSPQSIPQTENVYRGIGRLAIMNTIIPNRPRTEILKYTVETGDTIFGIAERFGLQPQTIFFANRNVLGDDPHRLRPGQELNILPVDGVYYEWQAGDGLIGVARFFRVTPEDIINFHGNNLDPETIGDHANPNIAPGTWLIIPGGRRNFVSWSAPIGLTRENPGLARQLGPGHCGTISHGAVGFGHFVWPTNSRFLSGFDFSPETNHFGIDLHGRLGDPLFAVDAGVVVYAGWNDWGYGTMVVIDHGNGWQSLYAHMSALNVGCGQSVGQGAVIGAIGSTGRSTGPHLHFELMHSSYGKVNPWLYLPE